MRCVLFLYLLLISLPQIAQSVKCNCWKLTQDDGECHLTRIAIGEKKDVATCKRVCSAKSYFAEYSKCSKTETCYEWVVIDSTKQCQARFGECVVPAGISDTDKHDGCCTVHGWHKNEATCKRQQTEAGSAALPGFRKVHKESKVDARSEVFGDGMYDMYADEVYDDEADDELLELLEDLLDDELQKRKDQRHPHFARSIYN